MEGFLFLAIIINAFVCAYLCKRLAFSKGLNTAEWTKAGFLLGPIAVLAASGMPDLRLRRILAIAAVAQGSTKEEIDVASGVQSIAPATFDSNFDEPCLFEADASISQDDLWGLVVKHLDFQTATLSNRNLSSITNKSVVVRTSNGDQLCKLEGRYSLGRIRWALVARNGS